MAQIDDLERRIAEAFDRIGTNVDALEQKWANPLPPPEPDVDPAVLEDLKAKLEEERLANGQLEERVKVLSARQASTISGLEGQLAETRELMLRLDSEVQRLKQACELLRENNEALRKANEEGVSQPHLINRSLLSEVEALRAQRAADKAEIESVLGVLTPLLEDAALPSGLTEATLEAAEKAVEAAGAADAVAGDEDTREETA